MESKRVCIASINYSIEVSPTIKNLALYLSSAGYKVDIIVDNLKRDNTFQIDGIQIINFNFGFAKPGDTYVHRFFSFLHRRIKRFKLIRYFKKCRNEYAYFISAEAFSFLYLKEARIDFKYIVFLFLENARYIQMLAPVYPDLKFDIQKCKFHIIQSPVRGSELAEELNCQFDFSYLPVSLRARGSLPQIHHNGETIKIIYSGSLAEWSGLHIILKEIALLKGRLSFTITLQGHILGNDQYIAKLQKIIIEENISDITIIDTAFINDKDYINYLSQFDMGLGIYLGEEDASNWRNLLFSSGKIASYLWASLPVLTNIDDPLTAAGPFLPIKSLYSGEIANQFQKYLLDRQSYHQASYKFACRHYDFDQYAKGIVEKMIR